VPIRQWVLSLPFDLRALAAKRPDLIAAIDRAFFAEIQRWMAQCSGPACGRAGAITFVQRFGGSLNLHVHLHVLVLEGVFTRAGEQPPVFHAAFAPTPADLLDVVTRVRDRVQRWLRRHDLDRPLEPRHDDPLDAYARAAIQPGLFDRLATKAIGDEEPASPGKHSVALDGFNLHAAVRIGADDDIGRERLVRYCARPPFALERLSVLRDGRIAYQIKQARKKATHRILTPMELLARIAALIPPPRHPFMRYHGVLAPNSKWRKAIVPRDVADRVVKCAPRGRENTEKTDAASAALHSPRGPATVRPSAAPQRAEPPRANYAIITSAHRTRLLNGQLLAERPRLDWAKLLRRTFADDVLICPRCCGTARVIAAIHDPTDARAFLTAASETSAPIATATRADETWPDVHADDTWSEAHAEETWPADDPDDCQPPPPSSNRASRPPAVATADDD